MRDLDKALSDIALLRTQMARTSEFRGYGPTTLGATGVLAVVAAMLQSRYLPDPAANVTGYLALWVGVAALSIALIAIEVVARSLRAHSGMANEMVHLAVELLLPSIGAGVLLTCVMVRSAAESLWMLPGLWQILLSLGIFASIRSVPRPMLAVGVWYLGAGLACIAFENGSNSFSPMAMGLPFGLGQVLAAALIRTQGKLDEAA